MKRALVLAAMVAGCSDPTFTLRFQVTQGAADACLPDGLGMQATQCQQVPMTCAAVVSIRVFNPNTPTSPVISVCQELMMASTPTLCEIAQVSLPPPTSPVEAQTLEVEILVYPKNKLQLDANLAPICPAMVDIGVDGFPTPSLVPCLPEQACDPAPAVGGIAFYHPGDAETVVELGCADLKLLNDKVCTGPETSVTASVTDFDTLVSVPSSLASRLTVDIGTPSMPTSSATTFTSSASLTLGTQTTPTWTGSISDIPEIACIQVDETDVAARTDTVRCKEAMAGDPTPAAFVGTRLAKATLDNILGVLGLPEFPDAGLVVGIVLDEHGNPAGGLQVSADMISSTVPTIKYLSAMRNSVGGTMTSASGIFLSTDAPFGTEFTAIQNGEMAKAVGGLIVGKVTIVVLQIPSQSPT